ncbi:MAG: lysylphosphatidylglycerol synthase domain-containing protein [Balneolales bacterium]
MESITSALKHIFKRRTILPLIGITLFILAIAVLNNEIQQFNWNTFKEYIRTIPPQYLFLALGMSLISYIILILYDVLALFNLNIHLPWYKAAKASFLGFAFSNNITPSLLVGGTIRYRVYSPLGVSGFNVTRIVAFCAFTLWGGFMTLGGLLFVSTTISVPDTLDLPLVSLKIVGWIFISVVIIYLILSRTVRSSIIFRGKVFSLPTLPVALGQITVASTDLISSSLILYLLLPPIDALTYPLFLAIYLLGYVGGVISQVPGGLGVIETILVLMLGSFFDSSQILSAVLVFRLFYFIIPLIFAAMLLGVHELRQRHQNLRFFLKPDQKNQP